MSLFRRADFEAFVASLPATTLVEQWDSHVAKVGGKLFALLGGAEDGICFKVPETTFEILTSMDGIGQAPYFAKRQWLVVGKGAKLPARDLKDYIRASHAIVASGLTKKLRAELGLS